MKTGISKNALACCAFILFLAVSARADKTCIDKIQDKCTTCHYPTRICKKIGEKSRQDWKVTIERMRRYGLQLSGEKRDEMLDCLMGLEDNSGNLCR